jgi:hypothetical protein
MVIGGVLHSLPDTVDWVSADILKKTPRWKLYNIWHHPIKNDAKGLLDFELATLIVIHLAFDRIVHFVPKTSSWYWPMWILGEIVLLAFNLFLLGLFVRLGHYSVVFA